MTISVPHGLKQTLARHPEINWSEVARQAWEEKAQQLEMLDKLVGKNKASEKDINELDSLLKKGIAKRHWKE